MEVKFYKQSIKDLKNLSKDNNAKKVLINAIERIGSLDLKKSFKTWEVSVLQGVSNQIKSVLKNHGYFPNIFEYRKFPKSSLFRIIFIINEDQGYIILISVVPHRRMNSKSSFNKMLDKRVKELFLH